jgi:hypothetical protein
MAGLIGDPLDHELVSRIRSVVNVSIAGCKFSVRNRVILSGSYCEPDTNYDNKSGSDAVQKKGAYVRVFGIKEDTDLVLYCQGSYLPNLCMKLA